MPYGIKEIFNRTLSYQRTFNFQCRTLHNYRRTDIKVDVLLKLNLFFMRETHGFVLESYSKYDDDDRN